MSGNITVDYEKLLTATNTTKEMQTKIEEINQVFVTTKGKCTESIMQGPFAENITSALDYLNNQGKKSVENFTTIENFLSTAYNTYKKGDTDSVNALLQITGATSASVLGTSSSIEAYKQLASLLTGGKFTSDTYRGMKYYVYVPTFSDGEKSGLPLCVFLHGISKNGNAKANQESFPKAVKNGMNVPGILLFPQSTARGWNNDLALNKVIQVTKHVAEQYHCDMSRISAAGHSAGGYGVHKLVAKDPNLFSCYLCYAVQNPDKKSLQTVASNNIPSWGFVSSKDPNGEMRMGTKSAYDYLESTNSSLYQFTKVPSKDHAIAPDFWTTTYEFNGQSISPIEWLFTNTKST